MTKLVSDLHLFALWNDVFEEHGTQKRRKLFLSLVYYRGAALMRTKIYLIVGRGTSCGKVLTMPLIERRKRVKIKKETCTNSVLILISCITNSAAI